MAQTKEGAIKIAAAKVGLSPEEYTVKVESGEKRCSNCKEWRSTAEFNKDSSRHDGLASKCRSCQNKIGRDKYIPKEKHSRIGIRTKAQDGDKDQARYWANILVKNGKLPRPKDVPCTDCGHIYDGKKRHEYDHYLGYDIKHHAEVQAVCSKCHARRERARRLSIDVKVFIEKEKQGMLFCSRCQSWKLREDFGVNRSRHSGKTDYCVLCKREVERLSSRKRGNRNG